MIDQTAPALDYRTWQRGRVVVGDRAYAVATKPGLAGHASGDPATVMLAAALGDVRDAVVVSMPSGNGVVAAAAVAAGAREVHCADRSSIAREATARTLAMQSSEMSDTMVHIHATHGITALPGSGRADVVALRVVPEKLPMLQLLHDALRLLRPGGRCLVAGANAEGAKSAATLLQRLAGHAKLLEQHSSHRLVVAVRPETLPPCPADLITPYTDPDHFHETVVSLAGHPFTLSSRPGVFSWEHLDEATATLASLLDVRAGERVLDLGCGAGALGALAARQSGTGDVALVDVDIEAVRSADRTLRAAGLMNARALSSDIALAVDGAGFDVVVANPPFHVGRHTDLEVPRQFMREAFDALVSGGRLWLVANRTLPYESMLTALFGSYAVAHDGVRFKVLRAVKP
ncbi:MAG: class I SAM-dependent methyltransferase [Gemmatimonadaceae bacterium]|nr:class I SAM-dependent methyltransferase [Gemmatimonadaceae bacterium]